MAEGNVPHAALQTEHTLQPFCGGRHDGINKNTYMEVVEVYSHDAKVDGARPVEVSVGVAAVL